MVESSKENSTVAFKERSRSEQTPQAIRECYIIMCTMNLKSGHPLCKVILDRLSLSA